MRVAAALLLTLAACSGGPPAPPLATAPPRPPAARPQPVVPQIVDGDFALRGPVTQGGLLVGRAPAGVTRVTLDGQPLKIDKLGRFLFGFGREAAPLAVLDATRPDGTIIRMNLRVAPRDWKIERIPSLRQNLTPNPVYEKLRAEEQARIRGARSVTGDSTGWTEQFLWPVKGRISGIYGSQRILGGVPMNFHGGLDVAVPQGTPLRAPASAIVALAGPPKFSLEGNLIILDHGNNLFSSFLHLSRVDVRVGQRVAAGEIIGAVGMTGRATGPHMHWGLTWGEVRVDPQLLLRPIEAPGS